MKFIIKVNKKKAYFKTFTLLLNILVILSLFNHFNNGNLSIIFDLLLLTFVYLKSFQTPYPNINALYIDSRKSKSFARRIILYLVFIALASCFWLFIIRFFKDSLLITFAFFITFI